MREVEGKNGNLSATPQEVKNALMQRSTTGFTVLLITMGSFSVLANSTLISTFLKVKKIQKVFEESRKILVDAGIELRSKRLLWAYFVPWFVVVLAAVALNALFVVGGFSAAFVAISILGEMTQVHSILFPPFLCLYFCSVVAETYRWLTAAISDPRVTQKDVDVNLWDKRLKEFVEQLSSALGIQALFALTSTIISTTASAFMILIELDFKESRLKIILSLSPFFFATLSSWASTAVFLRAAHHIREGVRPSWHP